MRSVQSKKSLKSPSAYFSFQSTAASTSTSLLDDDIRNSNRNNRINEDRDHSAYLEEYVENRNLSVPISFPQIRRVLWDRTPISPPKYIHPSDIIPSLYLSNSMAGKLLSGLSTCENFIDRAIAISSYNSMISSIQQISLPFGQQISTHILLFKDDCVLEDYYTSTKQGSKNCEVSIPFESVTTTSTFQLSTIITIDDLLFSKESIEPIVDSLAREMRSSEDLNIKSVMRIRAKGKVPQQGYGTLRLEAIIPNMTFQIVPIYPIPILSTPLSENLMSRSKNVGSKFGYLTMNQTRNVVPISSTDSALRLCPIVGVWINGEFSDHNNDDNSNHDDENNKKIRHISECMRNPFVWGACVKYLASDKIKDRAFIAPYTFLVVIFHPIETLFWEVTLLPSDLLSDSNEIHSSHHTSDYITLDFAVDLSMDDITRDRNGGILCLFRRMISDTTRTVNSIPSTRNSTTPGSPNYEKYPNHIQEASTPQPRVIVPNPTSVPHDYPSIPYRSYRNNVNNSTNKLMSRSLNLGSPGLFSSLIHYSQSTNNDRKESSDQMFPSSIVLAQQMQIDLLTRQVEELKAFILSHGRNFDYLNSDKSNSMESIHNQNIGSNNSVNSNHQFGHHRSKSINNDIVPSTNDSMIPNIGSESSFGMDPINIHPVKMETSDESTSYLSDRIISSEQNSRFVASKEYDDDDNDDDNNDDDNDDDNHNHSNMNNDVDSHMVMKSYENISFRLGFENPSRIAPLHSNRQLYDHSLFYEESESILAIESKYLGMR